MHGTQMVKYAIVKNKKQISQLVKTRKQGEVPQSNIITITWHNKAPI